MDTHSIIFLIFLIFSGASVLATVALVTRQSLLVSYILLGFILGPWGLKLITNTEVIHHFSEVGIIFLLFLLGLHLQPQNLLSMLKKVTGVAIISSLTFLLLGFVVAFYYMHLTYYESIIIGMSMMFSSTIIGLKLLPTTVLHHKHTGEVMISVLLMQDLGAIISLLVLDGAANGHFSPYDVAKIVVGLPMLFFIAYICEKYILVNLIRKFDRTQEYIFILSIGWCLSLSQLSTYFGLSEEIGAFIAGVALAECPISLFIAESLKPLRDFFLVLFFFSIGASFNVQYLPQVAVPASMLAVMLILIKPFSFEKLLRMTGETQRISREVGWRLGQASEFSILLGAFATKLALIGEEATYMIQATTILTFIISSYIVVLNYPTPIATNEKMRKD